MTTSVKALLSIAMLGNAALAQGTCNLATTGTCNLPSWVAGCSASRGPTECVGSFPHKTCQCQPGFCATTNGTVCVKVPGSTATKDEIAVIVLDPMWDDSDAFASHVSLLREFKLVKVMIKLGASQSFYKGVPPADVYKRFAYNSNTADPEKAAAEICPQLKALGIPIAAIIPTSDPTVQLTDLLAHCIGIRGNPSFGPLAMARRDKWTMGEAVRKAGLRAVREKRVTTWAETKDFLESWDPPLSDQTPCVFKIPGGVGGIGDYKVKNMQQAKDIFDQMGKTSFKGIGKVSTFLIQEYLQGREYAVDSISRDGVHKVVAVWFEDFRGANGIFDQYFGFKLLDPEDAFTKRIIAYGFASLDAIGVYNGAANTEIKYLDAEGTPCLVETNARWAGINWNDGLGVEQAALGNDQITAAFSAYLDGPAFAKMPDVLPLKKRGAMIFGINYQDGLLTGTPGFEAAKKYPSYFNSYLQCTVGEHLAPTTPSTAPFTMGFVSDSQDDVDADYARVIQNEKDNKIFTVVTKSSNLIALGSSSFMGLAALAMLVVGAVAFFAATASKQEPTDDIEYMAVE